VVSVFRRKGRGKQSTGRTEARVPLQRFDLIVGWRKVLSDNIKSVEGGLGTNMGPKTTRRTVGYWRKRVDVLNPACHCIEGMCDHIKGIQTLQGGRKHYTKEKREGQTVFSIREGEGQDIGGEIGYKREDEKKC